MCDVIKIRLKRRIGTRSGKGNQPLNIKTVLEIWLYFAAKFLMVLGKDLI